MRGLRLWSVVLVVCLASVPAFGATDIFLKFENPSVTGGSTASGHAGEIEVLSWSHSYVRPERPSDPVPGHQNLSVTKYIDASTNDILNYTWSGKPIGKVTLSCFRRGMDDKLSLYLVVTMENVVIADYRISGGAGDVPVETLQFDYGKIKYTYIPQGGTAEEASAVRHP